MKVTKEDFNKVVKVLSKSKYPMTIMLVPKWDEIDIVIGQDAPDQIVDDIGQRLDSIGLNWGGSSGISISGASSNYDRREYSDIFRVNGGHKDYYYESTNKKDLQLIQEFFSKPIYENENIISEISDADIIKAVAKVADVSPKELVAKAKEDKVEESVVLTGITVLGLIPPALELIGNLTNSISQSYKLTGEEKEDYNDLWKKYYDEKDSSKKKELKKEIDEKYGSKLGNWLKNTGHKWHKAYTWPIRKMLNFAGKFAKEGSSLKDKEKNEIRANIIYAVIMAGIAGFGIWSHIGHLKGIAPVATFIADSVKEGISITDTIEGAFQLAKLA
jgi:hypothetical protein